MENDWKKIKTYQKTAKKVPGFHLRSNKQWITAESWKKRDDRRELKRKMDSIRSERVRGQLRNAYLTKKGRCNNWNGKTLMVLAAQFLGRIIVTRIRNARIIKCVKNRQVSGKTAVQRNKYLYCATSLNSVLNGTLTFIVCLVDFEKAFDSVNRLYYEGLSEATCSIPENILKIVKVMYSGNECAVIDGSGIYGWFEIKIIIIVIIIIIIIIDI